ncbi:APC family permease [Thermogemmatispora sp.]|uniref:APC family permease n=1 Tax=Thermogemmatispora sp. TaxID=1968838 RepID=UPI0035E40AB4
MALYSESGKWRSAQEPLASEEYVVKAMPAVLGTLEMSAFFIVIVFFITNSNTASAAGPAALTYLLIGAIVFFLPSVIATAQLGAMFPYEGSLYNWTHKAFGGYWSFFAAFCAWFPGVLVMVSAADNVLAFIQGLNRQWVLQPWQQGLIIIGTLVLAGLLALQRFRTVVNVVLVAAGAILGAVCLLGGAAAWWLLSGHGPLSDFSEFSAWLPRLAPQGGNIATFGLVILAYLGAETPLNMAGELKHRRVVTRHLWWGPLVVLLGYLVATTALLVVEGPTSGALLPALVATVDLSLGKIAGNLMAVCLIIFFFTAIVAYNCSYARLLLVAGIDQRLPAGVGRLNRNRVPARAILFQTVMAIMLATLIFIVAPLVVHVGSPADLTTEVYNVMLASSTLVWATSASFLFANLIMLALRNREVLHAQLIVPAPILWGSVVLGLISSLFAVVDSLIFSWIPSLIPNTSWWYIIGGVTCFCLIIAAIGSMFAASEADWQGLSKW